MADVKRILLLDIDGVLLQPGGYRAAVKATLNTLTRQAGLPDLAPDEETLAFFESRGITNEWDMVPICLATICEQILKQRPEIILEADWARAASKIQEAHPEMGGIDYLGSVQAIVPFLGAGKSPSAAIYEAAINEWPAYPFPRLGKQPLFASLFKDTKDISTSFTTRLFQTYVLGSDVFQQIYHTDPSVKTSSFLRNYDRPLISKNSKEKLLDFINKRVVSPVACTARPSLPPAGSIAVLDGYSPEAEMALDLLGLASIPLIACGRLSFAAGLFQVSADQLIKPSPYQALAAILMAGLSAEDEINVLIAAGALCQIGEQASSGASLYSENVDILKILTELRSLPLAIDVIEDSPIGIKSARQACQILSRQGIKVIFRSWGVTQDIEKKRTLEKEGAVVYRSVDEALNSIL